MKTDERLNKFYQDLCDWMISGESKYYFRKSAAVCLCLYAWSKENRLTETELNQCIALLREHFNDAGLDVVFPFNNGNAGEFFKENDEGMTWFNPARRGFILEKVEQ